MKSSISSLSRTLALVPPVIVLSASESEAGLYLKVETTPGTTIPGESTDKGHEAWILASGATFSLNNAASIIGGVITAAGPTASPLIVSKALDKASPALFLKCAEGDQLAKVTLEFTATGASGADQTYYRLTLENVLISSLSSTSASDRPLESVAFSFEKITSEYFAKDGKGNYPTTPTSTSTYNFAGVSKK